MTDDDLDAFYVASVGKEADFIDCDVSYFNCCGFVSKHRGYLLYLFCHFSVDPTQDHGRFVTHPTDSPLVIRLTYPIHRVMNHAVGPNLSKKLCRTEVKRWRRAPSVSYTCDVQEPYVGLCLCAIILLPVF